MFDANQEEGQTSAPNAPIDASRPGLPLEPTRLILALRSRAKTLIAIAILSSAIGALIGKFAIHKTYTATAILLWQPPSSAQSDPARELTTLALSVKLPSTVRVIRQRLSLASTIEQLSSRIEVLTTQNSMLITIKAKAATREDSAALANGTVEAFLEAQKEVAASRLRETAQALRHSLGQAEGSVSIARGNYDKFRKDHSISEVSADVESAIRELARLRVAENDAQIDLESLGAKEKSLRSATEGMSETVVASRNEQRPDLLKLSQLESDLAAARAIHTPEHPVVKSLEAEVSAMRLRSIDAGIAISSQVVARNAVHDTLSTQTAESSAVRKAVEQRRKSLTEIRGKAEQRAMSLSGVQGEAARLLADVQISEEHVNLLLKQIAMAEDDVRGATSGFNTVSSAAPPEQSDKGMGKIVAIAVPSCSFLLALLFFWGKEIGRLRIKTAREAAYFANAPVLWSTTFPHDSNAEQRELTRELANAYESRCAVVGVASIGEAKEQEALLEALVTRFESRKIRSVVLDTTGQADDTADLADMLESGSFGEQIAFWQTQNQLVFVRLPSLLKVAATRAALRWLDSLLVVIPSGEVSMAALASLRQSIGLPQGGLALVLTRVPSTLLKSSNRTVGVLTSIWKAKRGPNSILLLPKEPPRASVAPKPRVSRLSRRAPKKTTPPTQ